MSVTEGQGGSTLVMSKQVRQIFREVDEDIVDQHWVFHAFASSLKIAIPLSKTLDEACPCEPGSWRETEWNTSQHWVYSAFCQTSTDRESNSQQTKCRARSQLEEDNGDEYFLHWIFHNSDNTETRAKATQVILDQTKSRHDASTKFGDISTTIPINQTVCAEEAPEEALNSIIRTWRMKPAREHEEDSVSSSLTPASYSRILSPSLYSPTIDSSELVSFLSKGLQSNERGDTNPKVAPCRGANEKWIKETHTSNLKKQDHNILPSRYLSMKIDDLSDTISSEDASGKHIEKADVESDTSREVINDDPFSALWSMMSPNMNSLEDGKDRPVLGRGTSLCGDDQTPSLSTKCLGQYHSTHSNCFSHNRSLSFSDRGSRRKMRSVNEDLFSISQSNGMVSATKTDASCPVSADERSMSITRSTSGDEAILVGGTTTNSSCSDEGPNSHAKRPYRAQSILLHHLNGPLASENLEDSQSDNISVDTKVKQGLVDFNDPVPGSNPLRSLDIVFTCIKKPTKLDSGLLWKHVQAVVSHEMAISSLLERTAMTHAPIIDNGIATYNISNLSPQKSACPSITALVLGDVSFSSPGLYPDSSSLLESSKHLREIYASLPRLTRFIPFFGQNVEPDPNYILRHRLTALQSVSALDLENEAHKQRKIFSSFLHQLVAFSRSLIDLEESHQQRFYPFYQVDIKAKESIERKARQRYHGDVSQVKDVLRGSCVFKDEASLVLGLLFLDRIHNSSRASGDRNGPHKIVRVKNLFEGGSSFGSIESSYSLPTRYRHILVTLQMCSGFLVEIQLHLASLLEAQGDEGYKLHVALSDINSRDGCLIKSNISSIRPCHQESHRSYPYNLQVPEMKYDLQTGSELIGVLHTGVCDCIENERDVQRHFCLALLLRHYLNAELYHSLPICRELIEKTISISLKRCLLLTGQSLSPSMLGWLNNSPTRPTLQIQLFAIKMITSQFILTDYWSEAYEAQKMFLSRSNQILEPSSPARLSALLDLAGLATKRQNFKVAYNALYRLQVCVHSHLGRQELDLLRHVTSQRNAADRARVILIGRSGSVITALHAHICELRELLHERLGGKMHSFSPEMTFLHHCILADFLSTLANCVNIAQNSYVAEINKARDDKKDQYYWNLSLLHYRAAFVGLSKLYGQGNPMSLSAAFALSRCLRQTGKIKVALRFLHYIVQNTFRTGGEFLESRSMNNSDKAQQSRGCMKKLRDQAKDDLRFYRTTVSSVSLWLMAFLAVEQDPGDSSRLQALGALHASAVLLREALQHKGSSHQLDAIYCSLKKVENEALGILRPLKATSIARRLLRHPIPRYGSNK